MGISIEQYRSSNGSHDNFVKTKDILSRFNDHFWSLMFVMFYLNVFYLPVLKQVVGQHKMWNDVMFWFSQMIFYNAYIPLLIRQASDVEENPGPTIFDVIDPTRTICADYSQGNEALFGENAGICMGCPTHLGNILYNLQVSSETQGSNYTCRPFKSTVLTDQFQTVTVILNFDWYQKFNLVLANESEAGLTSPLVCSNTK
nr:uncharacterized protein LOC131790893 [Pocillopora verrucosa]